MSRASGAANPTSRPAPPVLDPSRLRLSGVSAHVTEYALVGKVLFCAVYSLKYDNRPLGLKFEGFLSWRLRCAAFLASLQIFLEARFNRLPSLLVANLREEHLDPVGRRSVPTGVRHSSRDYSVAPNVAANARARGSAADASANGVHMKVFDVDQMILRRLPVVRVPSNADEQGWIVPARFRRNDSVALLPRRQRLANERTDSIRPRRPRLPLLGDPEVDRFNGSDRNID